MSEDIIVEKLEKVFYECDKHIQRLQIRTILLYLKEDIEGKPFIDILNLLEKLSLIHSANTWKELRDDRNELAHNYEDEPQQMSETINILFSKKDVLINIYFEIKEYYEKRKV